MVPKRPNGAQRKSQAPSVDPQLCTPRKLGATFQRSRSSFNCPNLRHSPPILPSGPILPPPCLAGQNPQIWSIQLTANPPPLSSLYICLPLFPTSQLRRTLTMASKFRTIFFFLPFLLFPAATAFNITQILGQFSDFSNLNNLLTRTQLASEINSRQTVTVLAVNNAALSSVSNLPTDVLKKVLALHVVLDYFDRDKITRLSNRSAILATLFQASGLATGQNGFLNVTDMGNGQIALGSAAPGSNLDARFVGVLVTHPYNISVLKISGVITPPGLGISNSSGSSSPSPAPTSPFPAPRMAPGPSMGAPRMAPVPAFAPRGWSMAPARSPSYRSPSPSEAASPQPVVVRPPAPRAAPPMVAGGSPTRSPSGRVADVPSAKAPNDDSSGARHVAAVAGLAGAMGAAFLVLSS
ncbi:fasciclin-like arabinogalactan protein 14 [Phoenix dactylifera]|uniref:Fasciclin-like arabinogalactan protein 14 n=1 Tax=Phoenix dactylifera TaxID=42345 RepID=A0A8B7BNE3_PHODC|nr:fasciclin-like arabinogalactan protein 14 [Phoenix dactylifera]